MAMTIGSLESVDMWWRALYVAGSASALIILALMLVQRAVFVVFPPPSDIHGMFALVERSWLRVC